ncbi:MAG: hypothetical protein FWE03_03780 [Firmicutes bacterium]|nr:hypothetical protein [Bacillota bacterium]
MAAGFTHNLILDYDGNIWAWGMNQLGQLGVGMDFNFDGYINTANETLIHPVLVNTDGRMDNNRIVYITAGINTSFAIDEYGNLWGWGANTFGNIVDGAGGQSHCTPVLINTNGRMNNHRIKSIAVYHSTTIALDEYGLIWVWGHLFWSFGSGFGVHS